MKSSQSKPATRRPPRPVRVPPPLTRGRETFEGSSILAESPPETGVVLWQSIRNVMLWTSVPAPSRKSLFAAGADEKRRARLLAADIADEIRSPLAAIARVLSDPVGVDGRRIAQACQRISTWAEGSGRMATSLAFMQGAALAGPDARLSYEVGRLARLRGEFARAETWYRRAILVGRQSANWEAYALAFIGIGNLYRARGNLPAAQRALLRAYRASRRKGLRKVQAKSLHDLFVVANARGNVREAQEFAGAALRAYGSTSTRLPALAHDIAVFWKDHGHYAPALRVLQALVPHAGKLTLKAPLYANVAGAAAALGQRTDFEEAWQRAWEAMATEAGSERAAEVFTCLARSAAVVGSWERASRAGERALELARARGESRTEESVESLLVAIRGRTAPERESVDPEPEVSEHAEGLAHDIARSLAHARR